MLFYCAGGDPEVLADHVRTMVEHVTKLMDLTTLRSTTMSEWIMMTMGS